MKCKYDDKDCDCIDPGTMECLYHEFYLGDCECFGEEGASVLSKLLGMAVAFINLLIGG